MWSGGSFIYVPPGVHVDIPLQAYFRINTENMGQFERTLIIADEGSYVHYVEGCTAPIYSSDSLHSAVVEIIVKKNARVRYTTIQNWSNNVYNLVTKRATAAEGATMEWVDGNIGSKVTMKYPAIYLMGEHAKGETLSIAFSGEGQHQDAGAKMVHAAPHTSSSIISKSVARGGGRTSYRGLVQVLEGAHHSASTVRCDALLVDTISRSDTYPYVDVREDDVSDGPRGHGLQGQRGPALLPDVPRHGRGRGDGDDRARLRRADRPRAAHGVRAGAQPADRAADGGRGRLTPVHACHAPTPGTKKRSTSTRMTETTQQSGAPAPVLLDPSAVAQHGLKPHSHGGGTVPDKSRAERTRSFDVADFPMPTGREEEWRFTPMDLLRGILEERASDEGAATWAVQAPARGLRREPRARAEPARQRPGPGRPRRGHRVGRHARGPARQGRRPRPSWTSRCGSR